MNGVPHQARLGPFPRGSWFLFGFVSGAALMLTGSLILWALLDPLHASEDEGTPVIHVDCPHPGRFHVEEIPVPEEETTGVVR